MVWAAKQWGYGLGFDVRSFVPADDGEKLIEVKTTSQGRHFPFYVTETERRCSATVADRFQLYRVFDLRRDARVYVLQGNLNQTLHLEPVSYRGGVTAVTTTLLEDSLCRNAEN